MEEKVFEKRVDIFEELLPYKDFFDCALHYVHREFLNNENLFSIDYSPGENAKRRTARIKIEYKIDYYEGMYEEIKSLSKKSSDRALVNNLLSSLVGVPQFKPILSIENKESK